MNAEFGDLAFPIADFSRLRTKSPFVAMMPQWDFLNFLADKAAQYPEFSLRMEAEVTGLLEDGERMTGVRGSSPEGPLTVTADLIVGADGRHSIVRAAAGLKIDEVGAPIDVFWFRLSRRSTDTTETVGRFDVGSILVKINRGDYWQCAFVIPKGAAGPVRDKGLPVFRDTVARLAPALADRVSEIRDWDDVKLLTVSVDRLSEWYRPGLLCIGDAAHAMSPVGGVGINLAIQDAVAAANILAAPLREGRLSAAHLKQVQDRRALPTRIVQAGQVFLQNRVIAPVIGSSGSLTVPLPVRLMSRFPILRRIPARMMGLGIRPEHVQLA
jgi:2-polyprenyl-6-methoxyphenol hydroxylase-like FAD-dependent oxidoreductase